MTNTNFIRLSIIVSCILLLGYRGNTQVNQNANMSLYTVAGCNTNYFPANGLVCASFSVGNSGFDPYTPGTIWIQISWQNSGSEALKPPPGGAYSIFDSTQDGGRWRVIDSVDMANGAITIANTHGIIDHSGTNDYGFNLQCTFAPVNTNPTDTLYTLVAAYTTVNPDSVAQAGNLDPDDDNTWGTLVITPITTLPVGLLQFNAKKNADGNVLLQWNTVFEQENKGFRIMRSADGTNWSAIGWVPSLTTNGNSTGRLNYNYIDPDPLNGNNYYRLKQEDKDGNFAYSPIARVYFGDGNPIRIYPNPVVSGRTLTISGLMGNEQVFLVNSLGQTIAHHYSPTTQVSIPLKNTAPGIYYVKINDRNGETAVHKILVK